MREVHSLIMMFDDFRRVEYTHTQEHKLSLPGKKTVDYWIDEVK